MKKLFILLVLGLGMGNLVQPAAAPKEGVQVKKFSVDAPKKDEKGQTKKALCSSWNPGSRGITGPLWNEIIKEWVGLDKKIKDKLYKSASENPAHQWRCFDLDLELTQELYSPDGRYIFTGSDIMAKIWDAHNYQEISTLDGFVGSHPAAVFSPDGNYLIANNIDQNAPIIWDTRTGDQVAQLRGHHGVVICFAYSADGTQIITGSADHTAKIWDAYSGQEIGTLRGHGNEIWSVAYSPNGDYIATGSKDATAKIWDAEILEGLHTLRRDGMRGANGIGRIDFVAFSPNGYDVITRSSWDKVSKIWNVKIGKVDMLFGHDEDISLVAYSPDDKYIVTALDTHPRCAKIWNAQTGRELCQLESDAYIKKIFYSKDGKYIVLQEELTPTQKRIKICDAQTGSVIMYSDFNNEYFSLEIAINPDGPCIIAGLRNGRARIWDLSILNYQFNTEQIEILNLLEQYHKSGQILYLSDIELKNSRVECLGLRSRFKKVFPSNIRRVIEHAYKIEYDRQLPDLEDSELLCEQEWNRKKIFDEQKRLARNRANLVKKRLERRNQIQEQRDLFKKIALGSVVASACAGIASWIYWNTSK